MAYLGKKPSDIFRGLTQKDTFTGDGSTVTFDLTKEAPNGGANDIQVFVSDVRQEPTVDYTLGEDGSGDIKRVTFTSAPSNSAPIFILNPGRDSALNTIGDQVVTAAKLNDNVISGNTALTTGLASTDELLISDAGTPKKMDVSVLTGYYDSLTSSLSNKTLTAPVISGDITTASGDLTLNSATQQVVIEGNGSDTTGSLQLNCEVNTHGQTIVPQPHSEGVTNTLTLPAGGNQELVGTTDSQTLTNKTINSASNTITITESNISDLGSYISNVVEDTTPQLGGDLASNGNDINFADNDRAYFGTGNDLEIYHDGSNSYIKETGTGNLGIQSNGTEIQLSKTPFEHMIRAIPDGAVKLYHNNSEKLETTSTGVTVTGSILPDGDDTRDIGSSSLAWANVYTKDLHLNNTTKEVGNEVDGTKGSWVIQEGASDLYIINRLSGKKYKFKLEEIV